MSDESPRDDRPAADDEDAPFGEHPATRWGADVVYRGRAGDHDYVARVRHRFLDTSLTVVIDGVEHDPKAEEALEQEAEEAAEARADEDAAEEGAGREPDDVAEARPEDAPDAGAEGAGSDDAAPAGSGADAPDAGGARAVPADDLLFRVEDRFTGVRCTVRRPDEEGEHQDAEVIVVTTAGLGGAGEVDVRRDLQRVPLAPDKGTPSAARERRRIAHPIRFAILAALARLAMFLLPLLGIGALLSALLSALSRPVREWARSALDALIRWTEPARIWIDETTRPVRDVIDGIVRPIREFLDALTAPVRNALAWLRETLLGWIPDLRLPFEVPEWVSTYGIPAAVVIGVFVATFVRLRGRREKLDAARASAADGAPDVAEDETPNGEAVDGGGDDGPDADDEGADADDDRQPGSA